MRSLSGIMVIQGVEHSGQLSQHPLAELLRETAAAGLSGAFRLAREQVKTVVYLDAGCVRFAVSNLRLHRLSECARRWNFVTPQQLSAVGKQGSDAQLGTALVHSGALAPDALAELLSLQAADVLRPALLLTEGAWSFDPRVRLMEDARAEVSLRELLMESARRLPLEFIAGRFSNSNETVSLKSDATIEIELQPVEAFVLSRMDAGAMRLHELTAVSGLPEAETLRAVYALAFGGLVERDKWPRAFSDETVARFQAAAQRSEQVSETAEPVAPAPVAVAEPVPVKEAVPEVDERHELEQFLSRMDVAEDHYEALALTRSADANAIKKAYHGLARRFHPDRFHQEAGTLLHTRLQAAFARVAQAYETLKGDQTRAAYNLRLEAERKMRRSRAFSGTESKQSGRSESGSNTTVGNSASASGEENFQGGLAALKANDVSLAISLLAEAARRAPGNSRYRAYYGQALACNRKTRHQAEAEIQAAISLDKNNATYRVMLAELYRDLGMKRRAQGELHRALSIDPQNADARRLLEELG